MDAYFTRPSHDWFLPTDHTRGPWDADSCHAGPPTALMARAVEHLLPDLQLTRFTVELMRPIPMAGFRVQAEIRRPGRQVSLSEAEILDDDQIYARAYGMHLRTLPEPLEVSTAPSRVPRLQDAVPGPFPIRETAHGLGAFGASVEARYDPEGSQGDGGPTTMWARSVVPILSDEAPSPFQRICPLADSGNGISYNDYLDKVHFVNPDLTISIHRPPDGEWLCSRSESHWHASGIGTADSELFDRHGPVGRATQNLLLYPPPAG
ncbi:MAG: thioesterase family protein [Acidimicrobiia bacterium]|nr:MAG: thioesterase family protein [Acidimicrobiia bacterium]